MAVTVLAGCTTPSPEGKAHDHVGDKGTTFKYSGSGPIKAVTTTGMINDIVQNVGGSHIETEALMGAGVDPHLYKATPGDVGKLTASEIIFYNGLHLEGKMADILEKMGARKPAIPVAANIPESELLKQDSTTHFPDPHVWFDVKKWILATGATAKALSDFDPAHKADYEKNAAAYTEKLKELDSYAKAQLATIPKERRVLVTAHDAFQYFGRAYDVEVMGLQGISTASEVSVKDVQRIVDQITSRKIKAVFVESSVPKRSVEAVVQGCQAKGHSVKIGGELFSDAMGKAGSAEGTYIGMVRHNVDTIVGALK